MTQTEKAFHSLGKRVKEKVTKREGVVTGISFDLYGCVQVLVNHGLGDLNTPKTQTYYDLHRIKVLSEEDVVKPPVRSIKDKIRLIETLGLRYKDRITGLEGTVTSVSFGLYGELETALQTDPSDSDDVYSMWLALVRMEQIDGERVMPLPNFLSERGPAEKPICERF